MKGRKGEDGRKGKSNKAKICCYAELKLENNKKGKGQGEGRRGRES
jgi:hypothetical protein